MNRDGYSNSNSLRDADNNMHGEFGMVISDSKLDSSLVDHGCSEQPHCSIFESEQSCDKQSADEQIGIEWSDNEQCHSEESDGESGSKESDGKSGSEEADK